MHRVQKFIEVGGGRIGYALSEEAFSKASGGATWKQDLSFNLVDTLLDDPEFAAVLRLVLRDGHVMVPTLPKQE